MDKKNGYDFDSAVDYFLDKSQVAWSTLDLIFCKTNIIYYGLIVITIISGIFFGLNPHNIISIIVFCISQILQLIAIAVINKRKEYQDKSTRWMMINLLNEIALDHNIDITDYMVTIDDIMYEREKVTGINTRYSPGTSESENNNSDILIQENYKKSEV